MRRQVDEDEEVDVSASMLPDWADEAQPVKVHRKLPLRLHWVLSIGIFVRWNFSRETRRSRTLLMKTVMMTSGSGSRWLGV